MSAATGLRVGVVGHEVHGLCGCGAPLGASGVVVLPEGGQGPMRALCGDCLSADPESAAVERHVGFFEALLLTLAATGCRPRAVVSEAAA